MGIKPAAQRARAHFVAQKTGAYETHENLLFLKKLSVGLCDLRKFRLQFVGYRFTDIKVQRRRNGIIKC